jgi:hypothetical protein
VEVPSVEVRHEKYEAKSHQIGVRQRSAVRGSDVATIDLVFVSLLHEHFPYLQR